MRSGRYTAAYCSSRYSRSVSRREELLDQVTDHVLEHGLIGLTLRPLAAAIGTSDRMLIYHFGSRDALVSAVVDRATARAIREVEALPPAPTSSPASPSARPPSSRPCPRHRP
jgi:AcrR family transcriptional regulator